MALDMSFSSYETERWGPLASYLKRRDKDLCSILFLGTNSKAEAGKQSNSSEMGSLYYMSRLKSTCEQR